MARPSATRQEGEPGDLVLDASAAGKPLRNEPHAGVLRDHLSRAIEAGSRFLVPGIFPAELRDLAARTARETGANKELCGHWERAMDLVEVEEERPREDYRLAVTHNTTVQDAQYIELALRHGITLVSYDKRQLEAAAAAGAATLSPRS